MANDFTDKTVSPQTLTSLNATPDISRLDRRELREEFLAARKRNETAKRDDEPQADSINEETTPPAQEEPVMSTQDSITAPAAPREEDDLTVTVPEPTPRAETPSLEEERVIERSQAQAIEVSKEAQAGEENTPGPVITTEKTAVFSDDYRADETSEMSLAEDNEAEAVLGAIQSFRIDPDDIDASINALQGLIQRAQNLASSGALPPAAIGRVQLAMREANTKMHTAKAVAEHEEDLNVFIDERSAKIAELNQHNRDKFKESFKKALHAGHHHHHEEDEEKEEAYTKKEPKNKEVTATNIGFNIENTQHHIPNIEAQKHSLDHIHTEALKDHARDTKMALGKNSKKDTYLGGEISARAAAAAHAAQLEKSKENFAAYTAQLPETEAAQAREEQAAKRHEREERAKETHNALVDDSDDLGLVDLFGDAEDITPEAIEAKHKQKSFAAILEEEGIDTLALEALFSTEPDSVSEVETQDDLGLDALFNEEDQNILSDVSKTLSTKGASLHTTEEATTKPSHTERLQSTKAPQGPALS